MKNSKCLISDEELLRVARECRSNSAFNELLRRYTYYAKALAAKYNGNTKSTGIRKEELEEVAIISFYNSYRKAKMSTKGFYLYWEKTAQRDIREYFEENSYLEGGRSFAGPSFDEKKFDNDDSELLSDFIGEEDERIKKEMLLNDLMFAINSQGAELSEKEKAVVKLFLKDLSFKDIAKELNISASAVYTIFGRSTKKLRKFLVKD